MIRAVLSLVSCIATACPALAQSTDFTFGGQPALRDTPRAIEIFSGLTGYGDLLPDLYGTPINPNSTELGALMVQRHFRNVCLGLEQGAPLAQVTPAGFASYPLFPYSFGDISDPFDGPGDRVLSPTGSIDADEDNGHPFLWLRPDPLGMTCRVEWHPTGGIPEDRYGPVANVFDIWAAWQFAMVAATRPTMDLAPRRGNATEWDRPCGERWCPVTIIYSLPRGPITMETTLNIVDIEGPRP
ncbi:hypothetical protein [Hasllibacter sp. MH4015]|uniref:hypothetical protein n=1 Tax=Hasllibacter sp. MH4015 TaxID=2854029 RepID=UPI001CD6D781|nr:hypothetical protein [Hasllibacter sp. MH4015]